MAAAQAECQDLLSQWINNQASLMSRGWPGCYWRLTGNLDQSAFGAFAEQDIACCLGGLDLKQLNGS